MVKSSDTPHRPTLRTLAEITGLGVSTVSQALRDNPEIAEDTRRRVKLAAQQAGYMPDRAGVRLRTGKTNVISLILNTESNATGFTEHIVLGISEALADTGYHLVVTPYSLDDPMAPVRYVVENRLADGVIISRTQADDQRVRYLTTSHMPFVTHGRTDCGIDHAYHDCDGEQFGRLAVDILASRGRKRIAHLKPPPSLFYHDHTVKGFMAGLHAHGLTEFPLQNFNIDSNIDDVRNHAKSFTKNVPAPDGYVSSSELMTMALISGLEEAGQTIGKDFDFLTKQSSPFIGWFRPELILVNEDHRIAGQELARAVLGAIEGKDVKTLQSLATFKN
jgi:LacI family transcriptional regulator